MPNWCQNNLVIEGKKEDLEVFVSKSEDGKFTLATYYPYETSDGEWDYDWCVENWGTKWDISERVGMVLVCENSPEEPGLVDKTTEMIEIDGEITLKFDTAWGPPLEAIAKIANDYPKLKFKHTYFEAGNWFAGNIEYGKGINSSLVEFSGDQLTDDLIKDLGFDAYYY